MKDPTNIMALIGILLIAVIGLVADCMLQSPEPHDHGEDCIHKEQDVGDQVQG